jgi:hypothetical protein
VPGTNGEVVVASKFPGTSYSTDGGITWTAIPHDISGYLSGITFVSSTVGWACGTDGTFSNGHIASFEGQLTSLKDLREEGVNMNVEVSPNPCSTTTNLYFRLQEAASVKIMLTNAAGHRVKTYSEALYQAGDHQVSLYLNDLSPGLYYYHLISDQGNYSGKLMLSE